jgi:hypothetical protein
MAVVTISGTLQRMGCRKVCICCKPEPIAEIEYESTPLTRLDTSKDCWSLENVAYPLSGYQ